MAKVFRAEGITVIMGGFHTSGTINMLSAEEPDIQELFREGICVVSGEVEGKWDGILSDFLQGKLQPLYSFAQDLQNLVDIETDKVVIEVLAEADGVLAQIIKNEGPGNQYKIHEEMGKWMTDNVTVVRYNDRLQQTDTKLLELIDRFQRIGHCCAGFSCS